MPRNTNVNDGQLVLVTRIKNVLKNGKKFTSINDLSDSLQAQHPYYSRKKRHYFRQSVVKSYAIAVTDLQKEGTKFSEILESAESDCNVTDSELVEYEDKNIMNNMITGMYKKSNKVEKNSEPAQADLKTKQKASPISSNKLQTTQAWFIDRGNGRSHVDDKTDSPTPSAANGRFEHTEDAPQESKQEENSTKNKKESTKKRKRRDSSDVESHRRRKKQREPVQPSVNFGSVGGNESIIQHLQERCEFLEYPELLAKVRGDLPKCFLFHGPTGCGKTLLANAVAGEYGVPLLSMTATELVGGISGDSEANIRELFAQAASLAPCVLFVDDVDAIATKRETATRGMEMRLVTQLSNSMDELRSKKLPVMMICATNRPNSLDEAFRRTGRFDIEYAMRFPNRDARKSILEALCQEVEVADDVNLSDIADLTPGYVGCDLKTLICIANACALHRVITDLKDKRSNSKDFLEKNSKGERLKLTEAEIESFEVKLSKSDFSKAMTEVKPTAKQEDVILVPNTTWDDIGGLDNIRKKLNLCIMERTKRPELYQAIGMTSAAGVLLVGPPGCGKTSVARAVANEAGINFLYIKGAELLNKYVGESEKNVRDLFKKAASLAPCVIFFDEIDAICPRRASGATDDNSTSRVTNQLLLEMSGLEQRTEVYVIAATNRLDRLDRAFLRPGRMDKIIYVGLPNPEARVEILNAVTKNGTRPKLAIDVNLEEIGKDKRCDGFSGADLSNLVQVAREACLEQIIESTEASQAVEVPEVNMSHFRSAFDSVSASVDRESKRNYEAVKKLLEKTTTKKDMQHIEADSQGTNNPSVMDTS